MRARLAPLLLILVLSPIAFAADAPIPFTGTLYITLQDAVIARHSPGLFYEALLGEVDQKEILILANCRKGLWEKEVVAFSAAYNRSIHYGTITESRISDRKMWLTIRLNLSGDPIAPPAYAEYNIDLRRDESKPPGYPAGDELAIAYSGKFITDRGTSAQKERRVQNTGSAFIVPLWPPEVKDFAPPAPGEHPKLLFRQRELEEVRSHSGNAPGRRLVEHFIQRLKQQGKSARLTDHAVLYTINGDAAQALRAFPRSPGREHTARPLTVRKSWQSFRSATTFASTPGRSSSAQRSAIESRQ